MRPLTMRCLARVTLLAGLLALLLGRSNAEAVSITIDATGPAGFSIFAIQMDGITAMQIQINYDVGTLNNPKVSPTGILLARAKVNTNTASAGSVQVNVVTNEPLLGSGIIATLDFDQVTEDWPGRILSASALVTEEDGGTVSVPIVITNPPQQRINPPKDDDQTPSGGTSDNASSDSSHTSVQNTPAATSPLERSQTATGSTISGPERGNARSGTLLNGRMATGGTEVVKGVFARFAELPDDRLLDGLRQLITMGIGDSLAQVVQKPSLALSDGLSAIRVTLRLVENGEGAPTFILKGAHCVSLKSQGAAWVLNIMPTSGIQDVSVTVLYNNIIREYPLAVAPPIDAYMANRRKDAPVSRFDSFVQLANYLVRSGSAPSSVPSTGSLPTGGL